MRFKKKLSEKTKVQPKKKIIALPPEVPNVTSIPLTELEKISAKNYPIKVPYRNKGATYDNSLLVYGVITGCGLYALNGNCYMADLEPKELERIKKDLWEKTGGHTIIATLGDDHLNWDKNKQAKFSYVKNLEALGFKKLVDYNNPNHGTDYRQHMYILIKK